MLHASSLQVTAAYLCWDLLPSQYCYRYFTNAVFCDLPSSFYPLLLLLLHSHKLGAFIFTASIPHLPTPVNLGNNTVFSPPHIQTLFHNTGGLFLHQCRSSGTRLGCSGTSWVMDEIVKPAGLGSHSGSFTLALWLACLV